MKPNPLPDGNRELAGILAGMPVTRRRLLDAHRPGATGVCLGCQSQVGPTNRWPCALYLAAAHGASPKPNPKIPKAPDPGKHGKK